MLSICCNKNLGKNPEKLTNIKPSVNKYNWKKIKFPS